MKMTITLQGSRKSLDQVLKRLLQNNKIKVVFVSWESKNNVGIGDHTKGDLL